MDNSDLEKQLKANRDMILSMAAEIKDIKEEHTKHILTRYCHSAMAIRLPKWEE